MIGLTLLVRRSVKAAPERLFAAWTTPELLLEWWGPDGVECVGAEVDLRAGGAWRIGKKMPDGGVLWIGGTFERVAPPGELVYSWQVQNSGAPPERVSVKSRPTATAPRSSSAMNILPMKPCAPGTSRVGPVAWRDWRRSPNPSAVKTAPGGGYTIPPPGSRRRFNFLLRRRRGLRLR
jgi:uncharacterized protein YndB with AHSA1/START domain